MLKTTPKLLQSKSSRFRTPNSFRLPVLGGRMIVATVLLLSAWATAQTNDADAISWHGENVGGAAGYYRPLQNGFTVASAGYDIWNQSDIFQFVYTALAGDGDPRVDQSRADDPHFARLRCKQRSAAVDARTWGPVSVAQPGGRSLHQLRWGAGAVGMWLRLARSGDTFTASRSDDGLSWSEIGSVEVAISASAYIGLALSSHEPGATTEAASSHR